MNVGLKRVDISVAIFMCWCVDKENPNITHKESVILYKQHISWNIFHSLQSSCLVSALINVVSLRLLFQAD